MRIHRPAVTGSLSATTLTVSGSVKSGGIYKNAQTITQDETIAGSDNAMSIGDITINSGVTVEIGSGATWYFLP
jgi:hypothetical protein